MKTISQINVSKLIDENYETKKHFVNATIKGVKQSDVQIKMFVNGKEESRWISCGSVEEVEIFRKEIQKAVLKSVLWK